ncbi:MAG TPA: energy-coupling factor transporter ATPase [Ktedonobacterales bacterium]|nr:energy-coupling factor transporter ATPase [Ktedonobacterales bacterium]
MTILVENLTHIYNKGAPGERAALRDISLRIEDGAFAAIVGVTGSGKSTLVQHFNGLLRPTTGRVLMDDLEVGSREARGPALRALRQRVALLFQFPEAQLFARTIFDDVAFGPRQLGLTETEVRERVVGAIEAVALTPDDAWLRRSPFALSGGQRRRVALAGVLAMRPRVLVLDEPSAGLDAEARDEIYARLRALRERDGLTIVIVSHDMGEVARMADSMYVLASGQLRLAGTPQELFRQTDLIAECGLLPPPLAEFVALANAHGFDLHPESFGPAEVAASVLASPATRRAPLLNGNGTTGGAGNAE